MSGLSVKQVKQQLLILLPFGRLFDFSSGVVIERIAPVVRRGEHFPNAQVLCLILPGIDNDREQEGTALLIKFPVRPRRVITLLGKRAGFADEDKKYPHYAVNEENISSPIFYASY